jgi:hypothetical protein
MEKVSTLLREVCVLIKNANQNIRNTSNQ